MIKNKIQKAIYYMLHNRRQFLDSCLLNLSFLFPDKLYLSLRFRLIFGKWIDWENPSTYNEKLQWLKLYNRKSEYTLLVDKSEVKQFVSSTIGSEYVIPTLGIWNEFDDIDFNSLPNQFVIKTTHGGGGTGVVICHDKKTLDKAKAKSKIQKSLKHNIYTTLREWPYKDVTPRVLVEEYISDERKSLPVDYKFYCFNGEPKILAVATEREIKTCFDYYDMSFNHLPFTQGGQNSLKELSKPETMDSMIEIARKLSQNIPHVRIDMYEVHGQIYFGEFTFFDSSGFAKFEPESWDTTLGSWIVLPHGREDDEGYRGSRWK